MMKNRRYRQRQHLHHQYRRQDSLNYLSRLSA